MIDSTPTCQSCSIAVVDSVVIGSVNDANIPTRLPHFVVDSRGHSYLVFTGWGNQPTLHYDNAGTYIGRIGASGRGPGEYEMPGNAMLASGDTLVMFEMFERHGQLFSPNGKYARRINDVRGAPIHVRGNGEHIVYAVRQPRLALNSSPAYVILNRAGRADSFALFSPVLHSRNLQSYRVVDGAKVPTERRMTAEASVAPDGSVWAYSQVNYRLEQHDTNGTPRKLFGVHAPGEPPPFLTSAQLDSAVDAGALSARVLVMNRKSVQSPHTKQWLKLERWIDVDSAGLLWMARRVPAPSWDTISFKTMKLSPKEAPHEETIPRDIEDRLYHTVIEVIDPRVGQLLARVELPFLGERVRAGYVGRVTANEEGFFIPSVYRLRLNRP